MKSLVKSMSLVLLVACLLSGNARAGVAPENFGDTVIDLFDYLGKVTVRDGEYAFAIEPNYGNELRVYKTINADIYPLTTITIAAQPEQMTVAGDYAYILHGQNGGDHPSLTVVNVADPAAPAIVFHDQLLVGETQFECYNGLVVADGFLWLAIDAMPYVYDVSHPWAPVYRGRGRGFSELQGNPADLVAAKDGFVYFSSQELIVPWDFKPSIISFAADPDDNTLDPLNNWYEPTAVNVLDFPDEVIFNLVPGKRPELFVSVAAEFLPRDSSNLVRLQCNGDGTLTQTAVLHAADDDAYRCNTLVAEGNYLYAQAAFAGTYAIDISVPAAMTVVGTCTGFDGFMAVFSDYVTGGSKATARIDDQPIASATGIRSWNSPNLDLPGRHDWNFVWYTEEWTDPWLDQIWVYASTGGCSVALPLNLKGSSPVVDATCEFDAARGQFKHHLVYTVMDCYEGCSFSWIALSFRTSLLAYAQGTLKIKFCAVIAPKSGEDLAPLGAVLEAPSPNPFNPQTTLRFHLPSGSRSAELTIHDLSGRVVKRLAVQAGLEGWHEAAWTGRDDAGQRVPSGVYFARLLTDRGAGQVQKLMLIK